VAQPARAHHGNISATIHTGKVTVGGGAEVVLLNARDLPLYYYRLDTAQKSFVSGQLAQFWPPLVSAAPTETGANGKLTVLNNANGHQVAYNGHFLYTFTADKPALVTGQGVQGFFVATPNLKPLGRASTPQAPPTTSPSGYRY